MSSLVARLSDDIDPETHWIEVRDYNDGLVTLISESGSIGGDTTLEYGPETALKLAEAITELSQRIIQRRIDSSAQPAG